MRNPYSDLPVWSAFRATNVVVAAIVLQAGFAASAAAQASIQVTKTPDTQQVVSGSTATFTITITNNGTSGISTVQVADALTPDCARESGVLQNMEAGATQSYTCTTVALTTGFTNTALATADGGLTDSANATVTVVAAQIHITKTPATQTVTSGSMATFTITVSVPTGQGALSNVVVTDPLTPACDRTFTTLDDSAPQVYTCTTAELFANLPNVITVTADPMGGGQVTASDSATVTVVGPAIEITKTATASEVVTGGTATFSITVRNTGDVTLTSVVVTDPNTSACEQTLADLAVSAATTYTCETGALTTGFTNTATVTASSTGGAVQGSASETVTVVSASITITKVPDVTQVAPLGAVTFTITVSNPSDGTLTSLSVDDPLTQNCIKPFLLDLASSESTTYMCTTGPLAENLTNVATVTATSSGGTVTASATAATVTVVNPVEITKDPAQQNVATGATATFTVTVTAGPDELTGISVADPLTPDCARALTDLSAFASTSYTCDTDALTADLTNTATVNATAGMTAVTANDSALVVVDQPALTITKTPLAQLVAPEATATFTITVSNPGTATFSDVTVSDPLTPSCDQSIGTLEPIGSSSYTCETGALSTDFTNVATVTGTPSVGGPVTMSASAFVNVTNPIEITKTPATQIVTAGGIATFTITVTNDGTETLTDVTVSDPLTAACGQSIGTLAGSGGSASYTCETTTLTVDLVNVATVTATSSGGTVTASATATVEVPGMTATVPTATGTGSVTVSTTGGGATCVIVTAVGVTVSSVAGSPPAGTTFPHGLINLDVDTCTDGATVSFTLTFPTAFAAGAQYWKYGPTPTDSTQHWYVLPAMIAGNVVTFDITDGGLGDSDLTANGFIDDPGGVGVPAAVPTLPVWAMIALAMLLMAAGLAAQRGRRHHPRQI